MARYVKMRAGGWIADDVWDAPPRNNLLVPMHDPINTGLLDADGNAIFRVQPPIGFGRDEEW